LNIQRRNLRTGGREMAHNANQKASRLRGGIGGKGEPVRRLDFFILRPTAGKNAVFCGGNKFTKFAEADDFTPGHC
jgi:hypothetical protein